MGCCACWARCSCSRRCRPCVGVSRGGLLRHVDPGGRDPRRCTARRLDVDVVSSDMAELVAVVAGRCVGGHHRRLDRHADRERMGLRRRAPGLRTGQRGLDRRAADARPHEARDVVGSAGRARQGQLRRVPRPLAGVRRARRAAPRCRRLVVGVGAARRHRCRSPSRCSSSSNVRSGSRSGRSGRSSPPGSPCVAMSAVTVAAFAVRDDTTVADPAPAVLGGAATTPVDAVRRRRRRPLRRPPPRRPRSPTERRPEHRHDDHHERFPLRRRPPLRCSATACLPGCCAMRRVRSTAPTSWSSTVRRRHVTGWSICPSGAIGGGPNSFRPTTVSTGRSPIRRHSPTPTRPTLHCSCWARRPWSTT